jgi:hypothetical protein
MFPPDWWLACQASRGGRPTTDGKKSEARAGSEEASRSDLSSEAMQVEDKILDFKGKGKAKAFPGEGNRLDGHGKKRKKQPQAKLRGSKSKGQTFGSFSSTPTYVDAIFLGFLLLLTLQRRYHAKIQRPHLRWSGPKFFLGQTRAGFLSTRFVASLTNLKSLTRTEAHVK